MTADMQEILKKPFSPTQTMSIAIAAPSSVPFVVGGAEKLWWGLQRYINENTPHYCELVKVCTPESDFAGLMVSYHRFYNLDLSHFDMVLSTKYPAWMVRHSNHHVYYQHPLRGLYERYRGEADLSRKWASHPSVDRVLRCITETSSETSGDVERILDAALSLAHDPSAPKEALALPGPLLRKIVHALDRQALKRVVRVSAISRTVQARKQYFPDPDSVDVIYHPSNLYGFREEPGSYLLTASRLVHAKRVRLLLKAYLQARLNIPLKIVGRGPELPLLREMAAGHEQVAFTGFVSDRELVDLYARSLAVLFIPDDEDLGLITLEAMHSAKPVLTVTDSGGAAELVRHGKTGWICPPDATHLARTLQEVAADPAKAARMGRRAREDVRDITWENMAAALFGAHVPMPARSPGRRAAGHSGRPAVAVLGTFPIWPPRGGGQTRIFNLYREVAADFDVSLVCLGAEKDRPRSARIAPGLWETRVPMPPAFRDAARALTRKLGISAVDLATMLYPELLREMAAAVSRAAADCDIVVVSHPYTLPLVRKSARGRLVYEAHNVEYDLKSAMMGGNGHGDTLRKLKTIEQEACRYALRTMACSGPDIERLAELHGLDPARAMLVPNGFDPDTCVFVTPAERAARRRESGLQNSPLAIFLGSGHLPNIQAVQHILLLAKELPRYRFVIVGSVARHFKNLSKPENVGFTGEVSEEEKSFYLACADVALNPMATGSGTNLKMLEYIGSGIPVVSTHFGARGLDTSALPVITTSLDGFADAIEKIDISPEILHSGRAAIERDYAWPTIGRELSRAFQNLLKTL